MASERKDQPGDDKPKRKRIIKATTGITTEEAEVEESDDDKKIQKNPLCPRKKMINLPW